MATIKKTKITILQHDGTTTGTIEKTVHKLVRKDQQIGATYHCLKIKNKYKYYYYRTCINYKMGP